MTIGKEGRPIETKLLVHTVKIRHFSVKSDILDTRLPLPSAELSSESRGAFQLDEHLAAKPVFLLLAGGGGVRGQREGVFPSTKTALQLQCSH